MTEWGDASSSALSLVWLFAAIPKIADPDSFGSALATYGWIPQWSIRLLRRVVPGIEAVIALALWFGPTRQTAGWASLTLLAFFTVAVTRSLLMKVDAKCGCFGAGDEDRITWMNLPRNLLLMSLALSTALWPAGDLSLAAVLSGIGAGTIFLLVDASWSVFTKYWLRPSQVRNVML